MKYLSKVIIMIVIVVIVGFDFRAVGSTVKNANLKLIILSDIHINNESNYQSENLKNALNFINKNINGIDGIVFCGDITNHGYEEEYDKFISILDEFGDEKWEKIFLMGNHDYWNGLDVKSAQERFRKKLKQDITISKMIKGYNLIAVSTENETLNGYISDERIKQIKREIDTNIEMPIVVFSHQSPENTIYGSGFFPNKQLNTIIDNNENVILFAGHSHCPVNNLRSIYQNSYTVVGTGSVAYLANDKAGFKVDDNCYGSQGLYLEINTKGEITISKIDFIQNKFLKDKWKIDKLKKEKFNYTEEKLYSKKLPEFKSKAEINEIKYEDNKIKFKFPQCKDKSNIKEYYILVKDQEEVLSFDKIDSRYYMVENQPDILKGEIVINDKNKNIILEIYGVDQLERRTKTPLIKKVVYQNQ